MQPKLLRQLLHSMDVPDALTHAAKRSGGDIGIQTSAPRNEWCYEGLDEP